MNLARRTATTAQTLATWILHTHPVITAAFFALAAAGVYLAFRPEINSAYTAAITWLTDHGPLGVVLPALATVAILGATIALALRGTRQR